MSDALGSPQDRASRGYEPESIQISHHAHNSSISERPVGIGCVRALRFSANDISWFMIVSKSEKDKCAIKDAFLGWIVHPKTHNVFQAPNKHDHHEQVKTFHRPGG